MVEIVRGVGGMSQVNSGGIAPARPVILIFVRMTGRAATPDQKR